MKRFLLLFLLLFCFSWGYAQDDVESPPDTGKMIFPLVPSVESPKKKPQEIQIDYPKEKSEEKASLIFTPLPEVQVPNEKNIPTSTKQGFNPLPSISSPQEIGQSQIPKQGFNPLPPISPPQETAQPTGTGQKFNTLPSTSTPQEKQGETPSSKINLNPLPEVPTPTIIHKPGNPGWENTKFAFNTLPQTPTPQSVYQSASLSDFSGGLNTRDFPTEIGNNEFVELVNFIWQGKKIKSRWGFTKYNTTQIETNCFLTGLYRYYKQDGSKILMAGRGYQLYADTTLAETGIFVTVKTGLADNSKFYSFDTFKDKCIVAHQGDYPFWYDKKITQNLGFPDSSYGAHEKMTAICGTQVFGYNTDMYWTTGQWEGYILRWDRYTSSPRYLYYFITSNSSDTLKLEGHNQFGSSQLFYYWILPNFVSETPILSDIVDSIKTNGTDTCMQDIYFGNSLNSVMLDTPYVAKTKSDEKFLVYVNSDLVRVNAHFDTIAPGDSIHICKKSFYKSKILKAYKQRIFLAGDQLSNNIVEFSAFNSLTNFPPDNYFVVKTDDGDKITALASLYDDQLGYKDDSKDFLGIFKNNSIYKLVFNTDIDYHLEQVIEGIGCVAPNTIANIEGKYLIFLHTSGVYAFDGRTVTSISDKIPDIVAKFNSPNISIACGGYYDKHYYLSYCDSTVAVNNKTIVFNTETGVWSKATFTAGLFAQQNAISDSIKLLFTHPGAKSYIYNFGRATTDTGVAIPLTLKSKAFDFDNNYTYKRITDFNMDYYLNADSVNLAVYTDFGDSLRYSTKVTTYGGNRHAQVTLDKTCLGRNFSFKLTSSKLFELGNITLKLKEIGE